jgi:hypothetical protein
MTLLFVIPTATVVGMIRCIDNNIFSRSVIVSTVFVVSVRKVNAIIINDGLLIATTRLLLPFVVG